MRSDYLFDEHYFTSRYGKSATTDWEAFYTRRLLRRHTDFIRPQSQQQSRLLDIGCGLGNTLDLLNPYFDEAVGTDISDFSTRVCGEKGYRAVRCDARSLAFQAATFDAVFLNDVLDHFWMEEAIEVLGETYRVLKPGGKLVAIVLNWHSPIIREHFFDDPTHKRMFTRASLLQVADGVGFEGSVKEEHTLTGLPGLGILTQKLRWLQLAFAISYSYSVLTRRKLHLTYYGTKPLK